MTKRAHLYYNTDMGINGYIATVVITAVVGLGVGAIAIERAVRLILRQIALYHSINLVELKTRKIVYWIAAAVVGFMIFYVIMQMADAEAPVLATFDALFGVGRTHTNIALMFLLVVLIAVEFFVVVLGLCRNAVVDKGVYTGLEMLDWHQVRDYVIDEERGILVLSSDKQTFSTLKHLTTPFRVSKPDIAKLKFILNKNKNKFSGFDSD